MTKLKFILLVFVFLIVSCQTNKYIIIYDNSMLTEEMILERAIKEEEHILTIILTRSIQGSHVFIAGESLDLKSVSTYYDQKIEKCSDYSCLSIKVNNRMDITLKIDQENIQLQDEISNDYRYLVVEKRNKNGVKLTYTNQLKN